ncbi:hypothetical protein D1B31_17970 [Neobacillus notoginsengisoli]|uniref:Lipoprotein n=1 Tax=Neobacillus notoginsengisoli TaxID=1578198 RepID=A0A417YQH8_9BACI|nr:hypothetical protein [Neobacillus notoginsengisoli]RHW35976.1 hypothetical protein D1B31_17970 [Neobacillus notoginsengisoli]
MKYKKRIFTSFLAASLLLTGCFNSKFEEEAKRVKQKKEELQKEEKANKSKSQKEEVDFYKKLEKPLEETILENDLDEVKEMDTKEVQEKPVFEDGTEFAQYTGKVLYEFYTQQITPEEYYKFLKSYGSISVNEELPTEKDALTILATIQDMFKKQNITGDGYKITQVEFNHSKRNGTFYRKVTTTNGEEYFLTSIIKENGGWKYVEDSPSPPYSLSDAEEGQAEDENITIEEGQ